MSKLKFFAVAICVVAAFMSCTEKDSNLGLALQDPSTIYNGSVDTIYGTAYTVLDDSLVTTGLNSVIIGSGDVTDIASTVATFYTNVSTPKSQSVSFDQYSTIDSVVLSLAISGIYVPAADSASSQDVHFVVRQLAQRLNKDSVYYSTSDVELGTTVFYDDVVTIERGDTMVVRLKLSDDFAALLSNKSYDNGDAFEEAIKGFQISLAPSTSQRNYVSINLSASNTRLSAYYTYDNNTGNPAPRTYDFAFGTDVFHFSHFDKNFTGACSTFNTNKTDSIGGRVLFLSPMGGTNIRFNIDSYVRKFHQEHPLAIIHYAELILPVNQANSSSDHPDALAAIKIYPNGVVANVPDMYDPITYSGFDGTYDADNKCYRMRITQHLQDIMRDGRDNGTLIVLSGRRTTCQHAAINGTTEADPIRVAFVYSE